MERRSFFKWSAAGAAALLTAGRARALEYYPNPSEKKWAVLYGTWCGTARDAAVWISEGMGGIADVFDVREKADLSGFDHLVIGGALRYGKVRPELEEYIRNNQAWLKDKVRGLFIVCGNMQQPITPEVFERHITRYLAPLCGVTEVPANVFLGRMTPALLEPQFREMFSRMGEYDHLKRSDCLALGREVLSKTEKPAE